MYCKREIDNNKKPKIKTHFAQILTRPVNGKMYYEIMYYDPLDDTYHIGFGSYYLEYVLKWFREEFEIV